MYQVRSFNGLYKSKVYVRSKGDIKKHIKLIVKNWADSYMKYFILMSAVFFVVCVVDCIVKTKRAS